MYFFFHAEDGIRDVAVTEVQTCALPNSIIAYARRRGRRRGSSARVRRRRGRTRSTGRGRTLPSPPHGRPRRKRSGIPRSEERRVGKESRSRWKLNHEQRNSMKDYIDTHT